MIKSGAARAAWLAALLALSALLGCVPTRPTPGPAAEPARVAAYPFGARAACRGVVAGQLDRLGLNPPAVARIGYDPRYTYRTDGERRLRGWNVWVRFHDRPGALVVSISAQCWLEQVYGRFGLKWPGVATF